MGARENSVYCIKSATQVEKDESGRFRGAQLDRLMMVRKRGNIMSFNPQSLWLRMNSSILTGVNKSIADDSKIPTDPNNCDLKFREIAFGPKGLSYRRYRWMLRAAFFERAVSGSCKHPCMHSHLFSFSISLTLHSNIEGKKDRKEKWFLRGASSESLLEQSQHGGKKKSFFSAVKVGRGDFPVFVFGAARGRENPQMEWKKVKVARKSPWCCNRVGGLFTVCLQHKTPHNDSAFTTSRAVTQRMCTAYFCCECVSFIFIPWSFASTFLISSTQSSDAGLWMLDILLSAVYVIRPTVRSWVSRWISQETWVDDKLLRDRFSEF